MTTRLRFTTRTDVAPRLSCHLDRFAESADFDEACREVWRAAQFTGNYWFIDRDEADRIMDEAVETASA